MNPQAIWTKFRSALAEIVSFIQWCLTAIGLTLMLGLFAGAMLAKFGLPTMRLPTAPAVDLMYYGIAWTCVSGIFNLIAAAFKK